MSCVPKALAYLIKSEPNWLEFADILKARFGPSSEGWTDLQMVVIAAMYDCYLTPFVEAVDRVSFLEHYHNHDGILVGTKENGQPHAIAKRNGQWSGTDYPYYNRIFYARRHR